MSRLTVVVTSPRVPAGLLSWQAWSALRSGTVFGPPDAHSLAALDAAGIGVTRLEDSPRVVASTLLTAASAGDIVWVAGPAGDQDLLRAIGETLTSNPSYADQVELEVLPGSWDAPGFRLLDVVSLMDRLRSPGGCPWDAEQTHASLAPYLIEEAYEALDAIETEDFAALREELGDVLLQVAFHARLAAEQPDGWTIDDVAAGLVEKLIRRHPHVFADREVADAAEVNANWDAIKAAERPGKSAVANVPMGQSALRLATVLQRKATRSGLLLDDAPIQPGIDAAVADGPSAATALWDLVRRCLEVGVDPEAVLRTRAREFREQIVSAQATADAGDPLAGDTPRN